MARTPSGTQPSAARGQARPENTEAALRSPDIAVARLMTGEAAFLDARPEDAIASVAPILAIPGLEDEVYADAQLVRLFGDILLEDLAGARLRAETILSGGERTGGDAALPGALAGLAYVEWAEGRVSSAIGLLRAAIRRSERRRAGGNVIAQLGLIAILPSTGKHDEAVALVEEARRAIEASNQQAWTPGLLALTARMHAFHNEMAEARIMARAALAAGHAQGLRLFNATAHFVLAWALIHDGDLVGAKLEVAAIQAEPAASRSVLGRPSHLYLEAFLHEAQSHRSAALEILAPILDDPAANRRLFADAYGSGPWLVRATLAAGRRETATAVAGASHWLAMVNPGVAVYADGASLSRALLNDDADALLRGADGAPVPWYRASAQEDAGRMLLRDDPVRAIHVLERALAGYEQAGSERDAARVRSRLRRRALATGAHHDRRRAATGWESLTKAQRRVALVVGSGMTNAKAADRLSVSRHTVDSHLRQVFGKLDINSRAQLVRLTVQRGEPADAETGPESSTGREPSPPGPASGMLIGLPDAPSFRRTWSPRDP